MPAQNEIVSSFTDRYAKAAIRGSGTANADTAGSALVSMALSYQERPGGPQQVLLIRPEIRNGQPVSVVSESTK